MKRFQNYIQGQWVDGIDTETVLHHAITGEILGEVSSKGLDFEGVLSYGRLIGGVKLRKMTFQ